MYINSASSFANNRNKSVVTFSASGTQPVVSPAEKFISDVAVTTKLQEEGTILNKLFWSPTAAGISSGLVFGYGVLSLFKLKNLKKLGNPEAVKLFKAGVKKSFPFVALAATALFFVSQALFNINADKKIQKFKDQFKDVNLNTEAQLSDKTIKSSYIGAMCSPISAQVLFNKNLLLDPITSRKLKKLIKHELVHAKQYETIVRSEDGIKKLNFAVVKSVAKELSNPLAKSEINAIYDDISADKTGKYANRQIHILGADVNLKNYITALYTVLNNDKASMNDIPIVIDEAHYEKVRSKKGSLTKEEEVKAEQYYQAQMNYPKTNFFNVYNPFSAYYDNLLEKEAYKESPTFITFIRKIFGKD